jgi:hypothetical protein
MQSLLSFVGPAFLPCIRLMIPIGIDIPNGPTEDGTRGLLKVHDPEFMKSESPVNR